MSHGPGLECRDERRRHAVRAGELNGLDYVEVSDDQRRLTIYFLGQAPEGLRAENILLEGCEPGARPVRVERLWFCLEEDPERDDCLKVQLDRPGGFSKYRLCVVEVDERGRSTGRPFPGFDVRYDCLEVDFKIGCPSDLDCKPDRPCPPEPGAEPAIDYLAKDYASFRRLILDRLALVMPDWRERHVPDLGIALVELLAYAGDHLSYYQDAVATEAYLDTARRRISVRRHVRLVDYPMHDGCNARAWVYVHTSGGLTLEAGDFCITGFEGGPPAGRVLTPDDLLNVPDGRYEVFEPVFEREDGKIVLREEHNEIPFHAWGDRECCLPRGATRATLLDEWIGPAEPRKPKPPGYETARYEPPSETPCPPPPDRPRKLALKAGDLLLFEEVLGPETGHAGDADGGHRHVVRLTRVEPSIDQLNCKPILEIEWAAEDALPFPLCLSAQVPVKDCEVVEGISVARGNVFLADHGRPEKESFEKVPARKPVHRCGCGGRPEEVEEVAKRFRPRLTKAPLTFRQPFPQPLRKLAASRLLTQDPRQALPEVRLAATHPSRKDVPAGWQARRDLLACGPREAHFVAEVDDEGHAHLRFGDGESGRAPVPGTEYTAAYRVGNGPAGNVGTGAIRHLVTQALHGGVTVTVRNPLPARGGTPPEPLDEVRLLAPHAFRRQLQRAVTADDYARLVERELPGRVQRAAAVLRWTGSWYEVLVAVDPVGGGRDPELLSDARKALHRYRRIGHDVAVDWAVSVPLALDLLICVRSGYLRGHVKAAVLEALSDRQLPDGRRGFFHPDSLTFGQGIAFSRLIAAVQAVAGVETVQIKLLARLGELARLDEKTDPEVEKSGFLPLGPLEVARLDDDPRFPSNGRLRLELRGGR